MVVYLVVAVAAVVVAVVGGGGAVVVAAVVVGVVAGCGGDCAAMVATRQRGACFLLSYRTQTNSPSVLQHVVIFSVALRMNTEVGKIKPAGPSSLRHEVAVAVVVVVVVVGGCWWRLCCYRRSKA